MTETLISLLLRLSEAGAGAFLPGSVARRHFGPAFDRLLRLGVLEELEPSDTWPVCPDCDCGLDARPVVDRGGVLTAACRFDAGADLPLCDDDLRRFAIHEPRLVVSVAGATTALPEPVPGLWQLGRKLVGCELFLALRQTTLADPALPSVILQQAPGRAALIAPRFPAAQAVRLREAGVVLVPAAEVIVPDAGNPHLDEPTVVRLVRGGPARLQVRERERAVIIDGTRQHVPERPFDLLLLLVRHACNGTLMSAAEFEGARQRVLADVVRDLKNAMSQNRSNADEIRSWFEPRRPLRTYVLTLDPTQIDLQP